MICFDDNLSVEVKSAIGKNSTALATPEVKSPDDTGLCSAGLSTALCPGPQASWQAPFSEIGISNLDDLPYVPPFPEPCTTTPCTDSTDSTDSNPKSVPPGTLQLMPARDMMAANTQVMPAPMPQLVLSEFALPTETPTDMQFLTGVLLNGYVGIRPGNSEELEFILLKAMPECYD